MHAPEESQRSFSEKKLGVGFPSWKSVIEFLPTMADLRRAVDGLKESNKSLREDVTRSQRQVDEQAGQLKVPLGFVQNSLDEQIDRRASRAATELFTQFISLQADEPDEIEKPRRMKR